MKYLIFKNTSREVLHLFTIAKQFTKSWVQTSVHSSDATKMWQQQTWLLWIYVSFPKNLSNVNASMIWSRAINCFSLFFWRIANGFAIHVWMVNWSYGGIFHAAMSSEYVLSVYTNIMVRCVFLLCLQPFATTNLAHSTRGVQEVRLRVPKNILEIM